MGVCIPFGLSGGAWNARGGRAGLRGPGDDGAAGRSSLNGSLRISKIGPPWRFLSGQPVRAAPHAAANYQSS